MGVNGEALQLHPVYKKQYFFTASPRESVSVPQVTRESVSGTASHALCLNVQLGSYQAITENAHSEQYRRQQTRDIFRYSFVLCMVIMISLLLHEPTRAITCMDCYTVYYVHVHVIYYITLVATTHAAVGEPFKLACMRKRTEERRRHVLGQ